MYTDDTIAAISTGMNNAGIGIIRISGDSSFKIARDIFYTSSGRKTSDLESHRVYYGFIRDGEEILDEVLLIPLKSPKSFTGEDTVEIDCHGGNLVMRRVLNLVLTRGARLAEPGEFSKRAFLNGRMDLSEAEAVIDIINSRNELALNNSIKQLTGRLNEKIRLIREKIIYEIAFIESALDDPEHFDLEGYKDRLKELLLDIREELIRMKKSYKEGKIISEGIDTVIIGKPNVGKSSLLNILTGEETAIVTDIAGTTRDAIRQDIMIGNMSLNITDTAGVRETDDVIERMGVEKTYKYADNADLIIMMIDSSRELNDEDLRLFEYIKDKNALILLNKSDLKTVISETDVMKYTDKRVLSVSAKDETGIEDLKKCLEDMFLGGLIEYNDDLIITSERHLNLIDKAVMSLDEALKSIDDDMPEDLISIDMTDSYESLGRIIGESLEDDIVEEIFSKFCMGK
ncbi:MAG: tRNA uridine-5-carboxymethylaminomethyl(34) synthesis GTPase MnmE [Lachnospiraceae bacterium]|nr:tRNA uridine-5-carboxymethylaminomethyl(34) synthesis GTPase MnmE [Lachnospiraceae bacterium]